MVTWFIVIPDLIKTCYFLGKTAFLGIKKDYFNYMVETLNSNKCLNDGLRFVKSLSEVSSNVLGLVIFMRFSMDLEILNELGNKIK